MIGNDRAIEYVENELPDMLGSLPPEAADEFNCFSRRVIYTCKMNKGVKPVFIKGKYGKKYDSWKCGNCGAGILHTEIAKFCSNCGCRITGYDRNNSCKDNGGQE